MKIKVQDLAGLWYVVDISAENLYQSFRIRKFDMRILLEGNMSVTLEDYDKHIVSIYTDESDENLTFSVSTCKGALYTTFVNVTIPKKKMLKAVKDYENSRNRD